jgi:transcriptional regulator with XRE-family HTH domain
VEKSVDTLHQNLVDALRAHCAKRGISLTSLPDIAGVGRSHYWEVLAGRSSPTLTWLGTVAAALKVPVEQLVVKQPKAAKAAKAAKPKKARAKK